MVLPGYLDRNQETLMIEITPTLNAKRNLLLCTKGIRVCRFLDNIKLIVHNGKLIESLNG